MSELDNPESMSVEEDIEGLNAGDEEIELDIE